MNCMHQKLALCCVILMMTVTLLPAQDTRQQWLFEAIDNNNTKAIASAVAQNPALLDSSFTTADGWFGSVTAYPIHEALRYGSTATITQLLDLGADPANVETTSALLSSSQRTSLEILVAYRDLEMVQNFIDQLAVSPEAYTRSLLVASKEKDVAKVKYLLSVGERFLVLEEK